MHTSCTLVLVPIATGIASFPLHVMGNAIDYGSIRIQSGGIKEAVGISPQTTGNDIFLRQEWDGDIFNDDGTLTEAGLHLLGRHRRYISRHALSEARLELTDQGMVRYAL